MAMGWFMADSLGNQRIEGLELRETGEVAVGRPELADAVREADGGDARVMDLRAGDLAGVQKVGQTIEVIRSLPYKTQAGTALPGAERSDCLRGRTGRPVKARMRRDGHRQVREGRP